MFIFSIENILFEENICIFQNKPIMHFFLHLIAKFPVKNYSTHNPQVRCIHLSHCYNGNWNGTKTNQYWPPNPITFGKYLINLIVNWFIKISTFVMPLEKMNIH